MDRSDIHNKCGVPFRALNTKPTLAGRAPPGTSTQPDSPDQLKVLSQAKDQALKDVEGFTYHETAGQDVRVYIIDSGVNLTHPVSLVIVVDLCILLIPNS